jgi:hypothetical protein
MLQDGTTKTCTGMQSIGPKSEKATQKPKSAILQTILAFDKCPPEADAPSKDL